MLLNREILSARTKLSLSRTDMARLLGVSIATYSDWERGLAQPSDLETALIKQFSDTQLTPLRASAEVREARRALGLTQVEMAKVLKVHPITVSRWEIGTRRIGRRQGLLLATLVREKTRS